MAAKNDARHESPGDEEDERMDEPLSEHDTAAGEAAEDDEAYDVIGDQQAYVPPGIYRARRVDYETGWPGGYPKLSIRLEIVEGERAGTVITCRRNMRVSSDGVFGFPRNGKLTIELRRIARQRGKRMPSTRLTLSVLRDVDLAVYAKTAKDSDPPYSIVDRIEGLWDVASTHPPAASPRHGWPVETRGEGEGEGEAGAEAEAEVEGDADVKGRTQGQDPRCKTQDPRSEEQHRRDEEQGGRHEGQDPRAKGCPAVECGACGGAGCSSCAGSGWAAPRTGDGDQGDGVHAGWLRDYDNADDTAAAYRRMKQGE